MKVELTRTKSDVQVVDHYDVRVCAPDHILHRYGYKVSIHYSNGKYTHYTIVETCNTPDAITTLAIAAEVNAIVSTRQFPAQI